ncbi:ATP-binding cassette domain-containing protein [Iodidimonas sp. SYSU 1G8]|uniref:ATP-binding cassette domain-containing protein n=1 Tax=Iodidimonas sp. SYSU 1G8 TaxID=3133967 RepID=UPI0031FF0892
MLELHRVTKRFAGETVIGPVDFAVPEGQTTVLIGPSGCGKSSLLRMMIGLINPDSGELLFEGMPLSPQVRELRRRAGYVIQEGGLFPHLSVADNIGLMPRHLGWDVARRRETVSRLCALTRFPETRLDSFPAELSGGQRQRVALMRALALDPDLLLLDEPLGALDPLIRRELQDDLRDIFRRLGKTIVLVTHDMNEAAFFADTIVLLRAGVIVQSGTLPDLLERPADPFVTEFIRAQRSELPL